MDLFREACGMTGPLHLRVEYPGVAEPLQWVLHQPFALIGREARAHLQLDHDEVSRRHAYLQVVNGRIFFTDLESRMGTHWESGPRRTGWLDEQHSIRIGPYSICHNLNGKNGSAASAAGASETGPGFPGRLGVAEVTLEFVNKAGRSSTWQMTPLLALAGSSPDCRVHLVGESVSAYHCSLVRTPLGLWVVDLFGRGGVRVNGQLMRQCRLDSGDQVQVGRFLIRVHYDTPPIMQFRPEQAASFGAGPRSGQPALADDTVAMQTVAPTAVQALEVVVTPTPALRSEPTAEKTLQVEAAGHDMIPLPAGQVFPGGEAAHNLMVPLAHQLSLMQKQMFDQFQQAMMMMFQMFNTLQKDQIGVIRQELDHLQNLTQELHRVQVELAQRGQAAVSPAAAAPAQPIVAQPLQAGMVKPPRVAETSPVASANKGQEPALPADQSAESLHLWLNDRVRAIQQERESRWNKIVSFLSGK